MHTKGNTGVIDLEDSALEGSELNGRFKWTIVTPCVMYTAITLLNMEIDAKAKRELKMSCC